MSEKASIADLRSYVAAVRVADARNDSAFTELVRRGLELTKTTDADFAEEVGVSRPTITRWENGQSLPHPALRPAVFVALEKRAEWLIRQRERIE